LWFYLDGIGWAMEWPSFSDQLWKPTNFCWSSSARAWEPYYFKKLQQSDINAAASRARQERARHRQHR
jgi:hypothetical protein